MSPLLFAFYMDVLIGRLVTANLGCTLRGSYCGCLVYADDVMLLAQSVFSMQKMLMVCDLFAKEFDIVFNTKKSCVMRIGPRFNVQCAPLVLSGNVIPVTIKMKYLGISIKSGRNFKVDLDDIRLKFYRAFNAIYFKCQSSNCEITAVELLKSYCLPILLYATEALFLTKSELNRLDNCVRLAFCKIFKIHTQPVIMAVRQHLGFATVQELYINRKEKFLSKFQSSACGFDVTVEVCREFL